VSCSLDAVEFKEVQGIVNIIFEPGETTLSRLTDQPRA
jgi:hypothetical protein